MTQTRAALFARYSSKLQDSLSLEAQITEMENHCRRDGWEITHRFLLPETRSAHVEHSEEFQDMIRAARRKEFDILVLHKLDRFGRNRETTVLYKSLLRQLGIKIFSLTEKLGESAYERMVEGFMEVIAEFYSLNIAQETRKGQRAATRAGRWTGGKPPYGYRRGENESGDSILVPDPEEAAIIRLVFEKYAEGGSKKELMSWIEQHTGKRWGHQTLLSRLQNPTYKGQLRYGLTSLSAKGKRTKQDPEKLVTGECHAIVPVELWDKAQRVREAHQTRNRRASYPYLLTRGTMICSQCGASVVGAFGGGKGYRYPYYQCPGWKRGTCERQKATRADELDAMISEQVVDISRKFEIGKWARVHEIVDKERVRQIELRSRDLLNQLEALRQKRENILEFIMAGEVGSKEQVNALTRKLRDIEIEEEAVAERLAQLQAEELVEDFAELEKIEDWILGFLPYLTENPGSMKWRRALSSVFGISWDFGAKNGMLYMLRLFPDAKETPLLSVEESLQGTNPRIRSFRSTQI